MALTTLFPCAAAICFTGLAADRGLRCIVTMAAVVVVGTAATLAACAVSAAGHGLSANWAMLALQV